MSKKFSGRKLYKESDAFSMHDARRSAIAHSNGYILLPQNEKIFDVERIRIKNDYGKKSKKSDYHTIYLTRHDESDRMKKDRFYGKKKLRNFLKKESKKEIENNLQD